jgi:Zn-dependent protease with chaperone function
MVILPLIYAGLIGLVGYGMYHHATEHVGWMAGGMHLSPRARIAKIFFAYLAPMIVGGVLLVFMVKPIFARPARREKRMSLLRSQEPKLFDFIDELCTAVGAPRPKRIDVNCEINAAAGFRRGFLSFFLPGDLVLLLGIPLVAGLSARQFAGVMAHEFGHFAQGFGMRFSYIISSVNGWFARVVYERDTWDEYVLNVSRNEEGWLAITFLIVRLLIWLTRKVLWVLMIIGHALSCAMLRQMEYDADRHEARLAGSQAFEDTARRLQVLNAAASITFTEIGKAWEDGKLPDNFPAVMAARADEAPPAVLEAVEKQIAERRTRFFDSHPCDAARIRRAARENTEGVFRGDGPASALFANFDGLCKSLTLDHYRTVIGPNVTPANLISTEDLVRRRADAQRSEQAAARYFCGACSIFRPLGVDPFAKGSALSPRETLEQLRRARTALDKAQATIGSIYREYSAAEHVVIKAQVLEELAKAGIKLDPKQLDLKSASVQELPAERSAAEATVRGLNERMIKIETVLRMRLDGALALLRVEEVARRLPQAPKLERRCSTLLETLARIHLVRSALGKLRRGNPALRGLVHVLASDVETWAEELERPVLRISNEQLGIISTIRSTVEGQDYPFVHAKGPQKMGDFLIGIMPGRDDPIAVINCGERIIERSESLYGRVMGELALIAEAVEHTVGLPRMPALPKLQALAVAGSEKPSNVE